MIIFGGWGILAFVPFLLGVWMGSLMPGEGAADIGWGLILGGLLTFAAGWFFNIYYPKHKVELFYTMRRDELTAAIKDRTFQPSPGVGMTDDVELAKRQMETMLENERAEAWKALRNNHTLFFIPVQWLGVAAVVLGFFAFASA